MLHLILVLWLLLPWSAPAQSVTSRHPSGGAPVVSPPPSAGTGPGTASSLAASPALIADTPCVSALELLALQDRCVALEKHVRALERASGASVLLWWVACSAIVLAMVSLGLNWYLLAVLRKQLQNQLEAILRNAGLLE